MGLWWDVQLVGKWVSQWVVQWVGKWVSQWMVQWVGKWGRQEVDLDPYTGFDQVDLDPYTGFERLGYRCMRATTRRGVWMVLL